MLLAKIYYRPDGIPIAALKAACKEVLPAAMSAGSRYDAGWDIDFIPVIVEGYETFSASVLLEVTALRRPELEENTQERALMIQGALEQIFRGSGFIVVVQLVSAWASSKRTQGLNGNAAVEAAIEKVRENFRLQDRHVLNG